MEYRLWTDIDHAMCEASARAVEWIGRRRGKDERVWAITRGIKTYTIADIAAAENHAVPYRHPYLG